MSHRWLRALEKDVDFVTRYLLARDRTGRLVGALPVHEFVGRQLYEPYDPFALFIEPLGREQKKDEWFPVVLGGTRAGYVNEVLCDPLLPESARARVVQQLLHALGETAHRREARSVSLMHLTPKGLTDVRPFLGSRAVPCVLDVAYCRIDIPWNSFDGYLGALTHHRRRTVRHDLAQFERSGFTVSMGRLSDWYERAGPLLANMQQRHGHQESVNEMTEYLEKQVADLDDISLAFLCHAGADLVGFSLFYRWEGTLYGRVAGFDYERRGDSEAYFKVAVYEPIRYAIENGFTALDLGAGSDSSKILRGATPDPMWSVVVASDRQPDGWQALAAQRNEDAWQSWCTRNGRLAGSHANKWRLSGA
jgi:predicted N-acyltransferase